MYVGFKVTAAFPALSFELGESVKDFWLTCLTLSRSGSVKRGVFAFGIDIAETRLLKPSSKTAGDLAFAVGFIPRARKIHLLIQGDVLIRGSAQTSRSPFPKLRPHRYPGAHFPDYGPHRFSGVWISHTVFLLI